MAGIHGITRYNNKSGKSELIAVWKNAPMIYNTVTGGWNKGGGMYMTNNLDASFETFLDCLFLTNGTDPVYCYNGTTWYAGNTNPTVKGKYIKKYNTRLYLGNITIDGVSYPSRVWYSDLPRADGTISWGITSGTNLVQTAGSPIVTSTGALFKTNNIKVGSKITIKTGDNAGEYIVQAINSESQLTLTENMTYSAVSSFWAGSNYFDVETDDGDEIKGFGVNSNELIILKNSSTHRYSSTGTLRKSRTTIGTSSPKSIVDLDDYTYFYHPSRGILRTDGSNIAVISNPLYDIINNVTDANVAKVVGWVEDNRYVCFYIGDVTTDDGESYTNLIIVFDTSNETWSTKTYGLNIQCATSSLEGGIVYNYVGTTDSKVYKVNTGTTMDGSSIHFGLETHPIFPSGSSSLVDFTRIRFYIDDGPDMQVMYKLVYRPSTIKDQWYTDSTWKALTGNAGSPKTEFVFPEGSRASGVILKFIESSTQESFLIEKFEIYYKNIGNY